jgi:SPP1 gp7 family putative phage head morphogenesis protein
VILGGTAGLAAVGMDLDELLDQVNLEGVAWAQEHAAELVGMRRLPDGMLIENPNGKWAIDETTREQLRDLVNAGYEEGISNDELADRISDSLAFSDSRAEMIARTETAFADVKGSQIGWKASGVVESKEWLISPSDTCDDCFEMAGKIVPLGDEFPGGDPPLHPNCFAAGTIVSASAVLRHFQRAFEGEVVVLRVPGVGDLTVTPNHPILGERGWVAAGALQIGDRLVHCLDPGAAVRVTDPDDYHVETRIEEVADALVMTGGVPSGVMPLSAEAFHGDGSANGEVHVVRSARLLSNERESKIDETGLHRALTVGHGAGSGLHSKGSAASFGEARFPAADGSMSGGRALRSRDRSGSFGLNDSGFAGGATGEAGTLEHVPQGRAVAPEFTRQVDGGLSGDVSRVEAFDVGIPEPAFSILGLLRSAGLVSGLGEAPDDDLGRNAETRGDRLHRLAGLVRLVEIVDIRKHHFAGHVFNLETVSGWYAANGIISSNCRCDVLPVLIAEEQQTA